MYFSDFMDKPLPKKQIKHVLSGDNEFLKILVIDRIKREKGLRLKWIRESKEYTGTSSLSLFGLEFLYILDNNCNLVSVNGDVIKLSKSAMPAPYKKEKFTEIKCTDLFPNQVETLVSNLAQENELSQNIAVSLCYLLGHDLPEIYNVINVLKYVDNKDLEFIYNFISMTTSADAKRALNYFLEGEKLHFVNALYNPNIKMTEFCWLLNGALGSIKSSIIHKGKRNWFQKRMHEAGQRLGFDRIDYLFSYVSELCLSFESNDSIIRIKLNSLLV